MALKPPRPPSSFKKPSIPNPPQPPPPQAQMQPYSQEPNAMAQFPGGYYQQQPQPEQGGGFMRNIASGFVFALVFGGIFALIQPRNTKITIDHKNTTGPLTPEQLQASVPLHGNRMVNFQHVGLPPQQQQQSEQQQSMMGNQQPYQRQQLPPPVALPQYQTAHQSQQDLYQAPPPQSFQQPPKNQH